MSASNKKPFRRRTSKRLFLEPLEGRVLLSTLATFHDGTWSIDRNDSQVWDGPGNGDAKLFFGMGSDMPLAGDWDGDGADELAVFRKGKWFFDLDDAGGVGEKARSFGIAGDVPVRGDWNGDGKDDMGIFRNGLWFFDLDGAGGLAEHALTFGVSGDVPVAGDWDGDGVDEIGVFRNGLWFFDLNGAGGMAESAVAFGTLGDKPVLGDWNGDGRDDLAIFRGGFWFFDLDGAGGVGEHIAAFGAGSSAPLILGHPPVVDAGAEGSGDVGQAIGFAGHVRPRFAETLSVSWDFGDGGSAGNNLTPKHSYASNGRYTVTLTATNQFGRSWSNTAIATVFKTTTIDAGWLASRGAGPYVLGSAQTKFVLQTDVRVDGTAFVVGAADVVLNLNGHTVTYGDAARLEVTNGGFEQGTDATDVPGWDVSQVPGAQRVSARTGMWGDWMLRVPDVTATVRIISDPIAIPEANREYTAAITPKGPSSARVQLLVKDSVTGALLGAHTQSAIHRGFSAVVTFTPTTTNPVALHVKLIPPSGGSATIDLDRAVVLRSRDYGVLATPSTWVLPSHLQTAEIVSAASNAKRFTLENGTMVQGQARGYSSSTVFGQSHNRLTVDRVEAFVNGMDTNHVEAPWASNVTVTHSVFRADVKRISDRMRLFGSINLVSTNGKTVIAGNTILDSPQSGIVISEGKDVRITNNEIRQRAIVTNGYAINYAGKNFTIAGNTIIPVQGRGIMLDTAFGNSSNGVIRNNYVEVFEVPNLEYGANGLDATALRIRAYGSGSIRNVHIHDNTFIARTSNGGVHSALGMRITLFNGGLMDGANLVIANNHFKGIVETADSSYFARGVSVSNIYAGTGLNISRNIMESNDTSLGFGDSDSYDGRVEDILLVSNTIVKSTEGASRWHKSISIGEMKNAVHNVRLFDTRFSGGAAEKLSFDGPKTKDVSTGWLLGVGVSSSTGTPLGGAQVRVFDKDNHLVFSGTTNAAGRINNIRVITSVYRQNGSDPSVIVEDVRGPHRVEVVRSGFTTSIKTVLLDQSRDVTFTLAAG